MTPDDSVTLSFDLSVACDFCGDDVCPICGGTGVFLFETVDREDVEPVKFLEDAK